MWNWVKNAVSWAGNTVKKVVNTVKNANQIIDKVSSVDVSTIPSSSAPSKVSEVRNTKTSSSWKDKYRQITNNLADTIKG